MTTEPKHTPGTDLERRLMEDCIALQGAVERGEATRRTLLADNERLREALRSAVIVAEAAVSAYEAKALKRDCFGKTRLNDFRTSLDKARAALSPTEKP